MWITLNPSQKMEAWRYPSHPRLHFIDQYYLTAKRRLKHFRTVEFWWPDWLRLSWSLRVAYTYLLKSHSEILWGNSPVMVFTDTRSLTFHHNILYPIYIACTYVHIKVLTCVQKATAIQNIITCTIRMCLNVLEQLKQLAYNSRGLSFKPIRPIST